MVEKLNILLLEDSAEDAELINTELSKAGFFFSLKIVATESDFLNALKNIAPDLILADYTLPSYDGLSALLFARKKYSDVPFIFVSGTIGEEKAIEAMRSGATDYVLKEKLSKLCTVVKRAICERDERQKRLIAEKELHESEEKFRVLYNNSPDMYLSVSPDDASIILCNETLLKNTGYSREEIIGSPIFKMYHDDCMADVKKAFQQFVETGVIQEKELIVKRKDGSKIEVSLNVNAVRDKAGKILYSISSCRDITDRKKAKASLQESQATFLTVLDSIDATIYVADMETYQILFMNKHMKDSFGADFTGNICWDAFRHESGPCGHCTNDKLLDEEGNPAGVQMWHSKNPIVGRWYINYDRAIKWLDGRYVRLQIATDITKFKKMEEQFRQAQKMEAIGTLAGGVAHDFNNILTTIIGNANLALMEVGKNDTLKEEIKEIKIAGERAAALTRQLLAFSRKQIIKPKILDLNELLTGLEKMLGRLIGEDVEILMIPESPLWQVEVDPGQIEQVIMNLAINARDAMPMGGKLTIETSNVDLDENYFRKHGFKEEPPGTYVMLAISDTGSGMDNETREHIFEPFYTTKEMGKGTGLGLSTVYGIVKQSNGFIWVYSEPGQGSTFKIYLPKVEGDVKAEKKERTPAGDLTGSETVLIVEDDDSLRKIAGTVLKQRGYNVMEAENGEGALRVSEAHDGSIDLLITDVVMPKMSGKETAERLQPLYPQMKVIYMSGYTDDAIVHHGVLAPGLNFLEKPFTPEGMARKVREVLDI